MGDPEFLEHFNRAAAHYSSGRFQEAVLEFQQAIRIDPSVAEAHCNLGVALAKLERNDEAIAELESAVRLDPQHAASWYNLGMRLEAKGRLAEAVSAYEKFIAYSGERRREYAEDAKARMADLKVKLDRKGQETMTLGGGAKGMSLDDEPQGTLTLGPQGTLTLGPSSSQERRPGSWHPGDTVEGLYEIQSVLGEGGFGSVYKVRHLGWGIDLAVKCPREDKVSSRRALERFVQEANTWVGLGLHPQIVTCCFVRILGGLPRIFIEYMEGGSLADWLKEGKVGGHALGIAIQIARAMEYAHSRGLVHRDLKPGNCLLTPGGALKVTDFGLAKVGDSDDGEEPESQSTGAKIARVRQATMTGRMGTPEYMSPEQWSQAGKATGAADIWAFGVILHELLCGKRPFAMADDEPPDSFYARMLESRWSYPVPLGVSEDTGMLIARCLLEEPSKRPASFREIRESLEGFFERHTGHPYLPEAVKEAPLLADALNNQGVSMADLDRADEALRLFERALKIDPTHPGAAYNQGMLRVLTGKTTEAELISRLGEIKKAHSKDWAPGYLLGLVHLRRRDWGSAAKALDEALSSSHRNPFVLAAQKRVEEKRADLPLELFVVLPQGSEGAKMEESAFRTLFARAEQEAAEGQYGRAYSSLMKARAVKGYEQSSEALDFQARLSLKGVRRELKSAWLQRVFEGAGGALCAVLSPDGGLALTGHEDGSVRLWEALSGRLLWTAQGHAKGALSVGFTPDGRRALSSGADGTIKIWDTASGKASGTLLGHAGRVNSIDAMPDGKQLLSVSSDRTLRCWDLSSGQMAWSFKSHEGSAVSVCVAPDGKRAVTGGMDRVLNVWRLPRGGHVRRLEGHAGAVSFACLSPEGRQVLSAGEDKSLRLWDIETGRSVKAWDFSGHGGPLSAACFTPEGKFILCAGSDGVLRLWDTATSEYVWTFEGQKDEARALAITPDGRYALAAGREGMRLWELDWAYSFPEASDWDEGARPYLESFLDKSKVWTDNDFQSLLEDLGRRGLGWLKPEGVKARLSAIRKGEVGAPRSSAPVGERIKKMSPAVMSGIMGAIAALAVASLFFLMRPAPVKVGKEAAAKTDEFHKELEKQVEEARRHELARESALKRVEAPHAENQHLKLGYDQECLEADKRYNPQLVKYRIALQNISDDLALRQCRSQPRAIQCISLFERYDELCKRLIWVLDTKFYACKALRQTRFVPSLAACRLSLSDDERKTLVEDGHGESPMPVDYGRTLQEALDSAVPYNPHFIGDPIRPGAEVRFRGDPFQPFYLWVAEDERKRLGLKPQVTEAGIEWVRIPGGSFIMGSEGYPDEKPAHRVRVKSFELAKTEVTFGQYKKCVEAGVCSPAHVSDGMCYVRVGKTFQRGVLPASFQDDVKPVLCVDWDQARAFAEWVGGRLPTEAEWEYAARSAGKDSKYPWGDEAATCRRAVMKEGAEGCGKSSTWPVCSKPEGNTVQGLCDMSGNVWEWTRDGYHDSYKGAPTDGSAWEAPAGSFRVYRGGSWHSGLPPTSMRGWHRPGFINVYLGFRPARGGVSSGADAIPASRPDERARHASTPFFAPGPKTSSIALNITSGRIAGQEIIANNPRIIARPGGRIEGKVFFRIRNEMDANAIAPLAGTPTWGEPSKSYWEVYSWVRGTRTGEALVKLKAPMEPGEYYIVFALAGTYNSAQIMSGTHPGWEADWINGNKVARQDKSVYRKAMMQGWVPFDWYSPEGPKSGTMAMSAIVVKVAEHVLWPMRKLKLPQPNAINQPPGSVSGASKGPIEGPSPTPVLPSTPP
ncbi:MAG TPA: hypothetical protein DCM05_05095 [Elusimicrobia bacterium]|nr:hypothetical protein [Elusimicrobiota bacterium]